MKKYYVLIIHSRYAMPWTRTGFYSLAGAREVARELLEKGFERVTIVQLEEDGTCAIV